MSNNDLVKRLCRYDTVLYHKAGQNPYVVMKEDAEGSYCDFAQVERLIESLQRQLAEKDEALKEAVEALKETKSDLFYQVEAKHGPKIASEYPSLLRAAAIVAKQEKAE